MGSADNSLAGLVGAGLEDGRDGMCIADGAQVLFAGRLGKREGIAALTGLMHHSNGDREPCSWELITWHRIISIYTAAWLLPSSLTGTTMKAHWAVKLATL